MGVEGTTNLLPGALLKRPLSGGPKDYFRNVEAEGSSPFTSTKESPGQRTEGGSPLTLSQWAQ